MENQSSKNKALKPYLWWKIEESELSTQINEYQTLDWKKSARKLSAAYLVLSTVISLLFIYFGKLDSSGFIDAGLMALLSVFCFMGHRWALMFAMIYWTLAKVVLISTGFGFPLLHIIWWALYMKQFYLAWSVERIRMNPTPQDTMESKATKLA